MGGLLNEKRCVLGVRNFDQDDVPFRSSFGNKITKRIFKMLYGVTVEDTQTGLRGFSSGTLTDLIKIPGERYEYEMNVLAEAAQKRWNLEQIKIRTIYIENNEKSHFRVVHDSFIIYVALFMPFIRYSLSGVLSFGIDIVLYKLFLLGQKMFVGQEMQIQILLATLVARILSSLFNFNMNRTYVFKAKNRKKSIIKYYGLCIMQMLASGILVAWLWGLLGMEETVIKICVDIVLFMISYQIQRRWVFRGDS